MERSRIFTIAAWAIGALFLGAVAAVGFATGGFGLGELSQDAELAAIHDGARPLVSQAVLEAVRLAPSACNSQPYHLTVCRGETARQVAGAVTGMGINGFAKDVPVLIVISQDAYSKSAALGAKLKKNDYRSMDIGIAAAYLTAEATAQGLGSCILGWLDDTKIRNICNLPDAVRLVIALGYPGEKDAPRIKKRKTLEELVTYMD